MEETVGIKESIEDQQAKGWRVKLYQLESEGAWQDQGTGVVQCKSVPSIGPAICFSKEDSESSHFLQSKIQCDDIYERQGGEHLDDTSFHISFRSFQILILIAKNNRKHHYVERQRRRRW
jgi:hypothetical protein